MLLAEVRIRQESSDKIHITFLESSGCSGGQDSAISRNSLVASVDALARIFWTPEVRERPVRIDGFTHEPEHFDCYLDGRYCKATLWCNGGSWMARYATPSQQLVSAGMQVAAA